MLSEMVSWCIGHEHVISCLQTEAVTWSGYFDCEWHSDNRLLV